MAFKDELGEFSDYYSKTHPAHKKLLDPTCYTSIKSDLVFVGMIGIRDPPRDEVHKANEDCREPMIKVMVITGDNKTTVEAICREIRLIFDGDNLRMIRFTSKEFMSLSASQQREILSSSGGKVFSHDEPSHKQEIIKILKEMGDVVAMTGDGVSDAPALKLANIGIAMGITGMEVIKKPTSLDF